MHDVACHCEETDMCNGISECTHLAGDGLGIFDAPRQLVTQQRHIAAAALPVWSRLQLEAALL